ncbi:MAG: hypothetical protein JJ921_02120 [Pseudomonadales bacterium]|nr:hypothetical protein [Pseudomonadales bacterium]
MILAFGAAMIGATAIAFSLIMFAMQVNVERMPYGLFRKFGADIYLLSTFIASFFFSLVLTGVSLVPHSSHALAAVLLALLLIYLTLYSFFLAYRRALALINPKLQLFYIVRDARRSLEKWGETAKFSLPLMSSFDEEGGEVDENLKLASYFGLTSSGAALAKDCCDQCVSYSRRYSEQGDHETSQFALDALVAINRDYVRIKGASFFSNDWLIENPLATDNFLNETLEHMRRNVKLGQARSDEIQIEQTFQTLHKLCVTYAGASYASPHATSTHAQLAAAYLCDSVLNSAASESADVVMEGVYLMGETGKVIAQSDVSQATTIVEKIGTVSLVGAVKQDFRPVTQVGVRKLSEMLINMFFSEQDIQFAAEDLTNQIKLVAEIFLKIPDSPLQGIHKSNLGPFYSSTSQSSFVAKLTQIVNSLLDKKAGDEQAERVIRNINKWADGIYQSQKELLVLSVAQKSGFTFDMIHWCCHLARLLNGLSTSDACSVHYRDELRKSSRWLVSALSWVEATEENARILENYNLSDELFFTCVDAKRRDCLPEALSINQTFVEWWCLKCGPRAQSWGLLGSTLYGAAILSVFLGLDDKQLIDKLLERLSQGDIPMEYRVRSADSLEDSLYKAGSYARSRIEGGRDLVDDEKLEPLLLALVDALRNAT